MTLADAGPLVALIDRDEEAHAECKQVLPLLSGPLVTTWPALTEAMYILGDRTGWQGQESLWKMLLSDRLEVREPEQERLPRIHELMAKYRDLPMDLADATLVVLAEQLNMARVFSLDADFLIYRLHGKEPFEVIP